MIETFLIIAAVLVLAAAAVLLVPLVRKRADAQQPAPFAALAWFVLVLFGSGGLYLAWSEYDWNEAGVVADTPAAAAAKLAKQLASKNEEPGDTGEWIRLARMYEKLGQLPLARRAYQRADKLANGTSAEAVMGIADILVAEGIESLRGPAGRLYERAIELDPRSVRAWMFAGVAAIQRGELPLARERIGHVLTLGPAPELRGLAEQFVARLDAQLASGGAAAPAAAAAAGGERPRISVRITLAPALAAKVAPDALLFVAARDPNNPGPPFAAKRLAARFPVDVELTPGDAMMPGRHIEPGKTYSVVARVALGGTPTASSGDPYGQVGYHVGKDGRLNIVIDKLSP
jgi:cytochrome c-type biogenesis protein CcmH